MKKHSFYSDFRVLWPIGIIFALAILARSSTYSDSFIGDEQKFYEHATNITHGFYTDATNPNMKEGPGYPLFLAISSALDLPFAVTRISNIIFLFFGSFYLFLILKRHLKRKTALIFTYLFALYPPLLRWANLMYAESLTVFLLMGFCFHFILWYRKEGNFKRQCIIAAFFMAFLALTKIIFAYVILTAIVVGIILMLLPKINRAFQLKRVVLVFGAAFVLFSPYLYYSYHITDKFFYLGMHGGRILYFRSTPFENEFGNSFNEQFILNDDAPKMREGVFVNLEQLKENHAQFFTEMDSLSWMQKDSVFKQKAIENMKNHPKKYVKNTAANLSRIFFHLPFSYRIQNLETLGYLIPNIFLVVFAFMGIYPAIMRRKAIPNELIILLILSIIYLGGHTLLGGRGRFLIPVVPIWIAFFSFVYFRILKIRIRDTKAVEEQ